MPHASQRAHVRLVDVSVRYDDATDIFQGISAHFSPGWTGIVGANGVGKSTLLQLLAGGLHPDRGEVQRVPTEALVHLCPQVCDPEHPPAAIEGFAWAFDRRAIRLMDALHLQLDMLERWPSLSPGERKRWQIGTALHRDPEVLLLDEPTNHVDTETKALLETALRRYGGVGVIVSHDREVLDRITNTTVRLWARCPGGPADVQAYQGGYSAARAAWEHQAAEAVAAREKVAGRVKRLQSTLQAAHERQAQKASRQRKVLRTTSHRDHDAHSSSMRGRLAHAVTNASASAGLARDALQRANSELAAHRASVERGGAVSFEADRAPANTVMAVDPAEVRGLCGPRVWLGRSDHVWLSGPSGAGKSTLAAALLDSWSWDPTRVFSLPQDLPPALRQDALAQVRALDSRVRGEVLSFVANLGCDPRRVLDSGLPSPGEARKLLLGIAVASRRWALVLDEPNNDLDLPSLERLEAALREYPGALLLITHDERFARASCDQTWRIDRQGVITV